LDIEGLVHFELVPQVQTVNQQFYLEVLKRLRDVVRRKRPKLWWSGEWLLHHDYAAVHTELSVRQILMNWLRTPFAPDFKGRLFSECRGGKKTTQALKAITLQEFQDCSEQSKNGVFRSLILNESILRVIKL